MRLHPSLLAATLATLCACSVQRDDAAATPAPAGPPEAAAPATAAPDQPERDVPPAMAGQAAGSLRVDGPAEGTISFGGFGPAAFGASAEAVRQAWGGDLGDAQPSEPGGCYYLIPRPMGSEGFRTAFMIEGDRFVRIDVRDASVTAPGGAKVGMDGDQVRALYAGRVTEQPHKYDPDGRVLRVTDAGGGEAALVFELDGQGRVDQWRIGVPPQVDYVEGCS